MDGEKWKQQRKLASFEFSTRVLRDFSCAVFRRNAVKLVGIIAHFSKAKQAFDIHDMLMRYALDSIFKVGFGVELNCINGSSSEDGAKFIKAFDDANELVYRRYIDPFWKLKRILNIGSEAVLKRNIQIMDKFVHRLIQQKRKLLQENQQYSMEKEDILSRFLEARKKDPEKMTDEYLRDIILNFMIAGKDTTANALSWFIYALCKNPIVQERIMQEVRQYMFSSDDTRFDVNTFVDRLTDETLENMHYLHASLTETLRLYPGVPVDGRSAMEDDILPDGYKARKGDNVHYLAYAMGRMRSIWGEDAEEFRPERWLEKGVFRPESPFKFVAFHAGPRTCLGKDFAYRQMKIVAVALLYFFRFKLEDEGKKVTYRTMLTLHIDGGLHVNAVPRLNPESLNI